MIYKGYFRNKGDNDLFEVEITTPDTITTTGSTTGVTTGTTTPASTEADAEGNIDYTNSSTDIVIKHKDTGNIEYSNINNLSTATDMGDVQQLSDVALDNATAEYNRKRELFQSGKVDTTPA